MVKGYEYEKGRYVVLSDEDFKRANVKATQTIDIKAFVDAVDGAAMLLITLRYADELRPADGLDLPAATAKGAGVSAKEIELAKRLVDDMTTEWTPGDYKDTYHRDLLVRIREKIRKRQTHEITAPEKDAEGKPRSAEVVDLMALLKRSLDAAPARRRTARPDHSPSRDYLRSRTVVLEGRGASP